MDPTGEVLRVTHLHAEGHDLLEEKQRHHRQEIYSEPSGPAGIGVPRAASILVTARARSRGGLPEPSDSRSRRGSGGTLRRLKEMCSPSCPLSASVVPPPLSMLTSGPRPGLLC